MMTFGKLNEGAAGAEAQTGTEATNAAPANPNVTTGEVGDIAPYIPADVIPAELPHPTLSSPLSRGARYMHHFEVELISDGKRLWHALSEEGEAIIAAIRGEQQADQDAIAAHKAAGA